MGTRLVVDPWIPTVATLIMTTHAIGLLSSAVGVLLAAPFPVIIASKIACLWRSTRWKVGWLAVIFSRWSVGDCLKASYDRFFPPSRTICFRKDLAREGRKLGLNRGPPSALAARSAALSIAPSSTPKASR
jgi:hypothetical protein